MNKNEALAVRLRQSIQGCAVHIHGPVQAWAEIEEACAMGEGQAPEIARIAKEACARRIADLSAMGVGVDDQTIKKEELTLAFIERLMR